ncbi:hypothetical protein [Leptospira soteropolitanensis]|uniref:Uncharacterized protein n=1 Tax=Leptospira soteropolitanensis TaxID=2950025 RepID=A0AAW5VRE5_9LEPT|nr:hypothetical protein [Leptospira soteropolitanensis]MCW7494877.1 hypothetical protein [Leptospira soteropolitanensis]MCW7502324.1 hypothetical protein [Leptospira soteropolitanensis]MCW7532241.1 hypothetical protein [Leptospira soteropolitanensis]
MIDFIFTNILISAVLSVIAPSEKQKEIRHFNSLPQKEQREIKETEKRKRIEFDTKSNVNLIKNCFEDPIFCFEYKPLINRIKENIKNEVFATEFNNSFNSSFKNVKFGCFCRESFDPDIYPVCPIEKSQLDLACQKRQKCLFEQNQTWINSNLKCDSEFVNYLEKFKKGKYIDYDKFDNESIELYNSQKLTSLINIKREITK